jgi:hypothetical protein
MQDVEESQLQAGSEKRDPAAGGLLPARLPIPPSHRKLQASLLMGRTLWRGLGNMSTHRKVLRRFLSCPPLTEIVLSDSFFALKYLTPNYLAHGLTVPERAECILHHYWRLLETLPDAFSRQILHEDVTIHEIIAAGSRFTLTIGLSSTNAIEGELSLHLQVDGKIVFVLSFTIVPGRVVESQASEVLFITRLQGVKGAYAEISAATKALHDVAPDALLLAALQGVAMAFNIDEIAAVSAARQSSYRRDSAASFTEAYDDFFAELGISKGVTGFYHTPVPIELKPLSLIKPGHKLRTKEKRAFKQQVALACAGSLTACGESQNPGRTVPRRLKPR